MASRQCHLQEYVVSLCNLLDMIKINICADPEDKTKVTLIFGNISEEDILMRRELEHLENTYPRRFRVSH